MTNRERPYNPLVTGLDSAAVSWIIVAVLAAIIEISIPHFGLVFVSVGAIAAAFLAFGDAGTVLQAGVFIVVTALCFLLIRPRLLARIGGTGVPSRTEPLIGREGIVTVDIDATVGAGRINVGGEDWAARSATPLQTGTRIRVVAADGIILEVVPV